MSVYASGASGRPACCCSVTLSVPTAQGLCQPPHVREITMSIEEQRRAMVLTRVVAGSRSMTETATLLRLSERSVWRLKRCFLADGPAGLANPAPARNTRGASSPRGRGRLVVPSFQRTRSDRQLAGDVPAGTRDHPKIRMSKTSSPQPVAHGSTTTAPPGVETFGGPRYWRRRRVRRINRLAARAIRPTHPTTNTVNGGQ